LYENRMNIGDSPFSYLSTYSALWSQFQAKADTKDTKHCRRIESRLGICIRSNRITLPFALGTA